MERPNRPVVHYTELVPSHPGSELASEWEVFRRELPRLLAEGHEGKHVLIKGERIVGLYLSFDAGLLEGRRLFPGQPIAVQLVSEWQPLLVCGRYSRWAA